MRDALLTFFIKEYWHISDINVRNLNETLTNDVVSFEQPGPGVFVFVAPALAGCDISIRFSVPVSRQTKEC